MERCEDCGKELKDNEVVWVRSAPQGDRTDWDKPQCVPCFKADNPNREPVLINIHD